VRVATVTAVFNEKILLPQFVAHYAANVDRIFLVDNESDDGSLEGVQKHFKVSVSTYRTDGRFQYTAKHQAVMKVARACAGEFDYVILVDADEFIATKSARPIRDELDVIAPADVHWTHAYNMFKRDEEPAYDPSRPLMGQRINGFEDVVYCKPIIMRPTAAVDLSPGMHDLIGITKPSIEVLRKSPFVMFHYSGLDEDFYVDRCMIRARRLSPENVRLGYSRQYYEKTPEAYRERYRQVLPYCSRVI
jgi:glycosyltransferase involved in cell wall biosynthesis